MPLTLEVPSDAAVVSHQAGVRFHSPLAPIASVPTTSHPQRLTGALRRSIVQRFEDTRNSYATLTGFAREEQQRLRVEDGLMVTLDAIKQLISRSTRTTFVWEQAAYVLREWQDVGAMCVALHVTPTYAYVLLGRLRDKGYPVEKRAASRLNYRGWPSEYRIAPRGRA